MNDVVIKKHDFDVAKQNIKEFSLLKPKKLELLKVEEDGGLFGLFDHNVTGKELNELTIQIQGYFKQYNDLNIKFIQQFGEVYKAFESLDKGYIDGILTAVKSAEKASMQAIDAQKGINKTIEIQKKTIAVLSNFKEELEKINHLEDVDYIWENQERIERKLQNLASFDEELKQINIQQIEEIYLLKENYQKFKQVDLQNMEEVYSLKENYQKIQLIMNQIKNDIIEHTNNMESTQKKINNLYEMDHIQDVDKMWKDIDENKLVVEMIKSELTQTKEKTHDELVSLQNELKETKQALLKTEKNIENQKEIHEKQIQDLTKKNKNTLFISGFSIVSVIIVFILNLVGIV